ncbi:MAG: hypothetical protein A2W93_01600 [Bacteroidetes bacterium GWF2_43_63]|nr:MAG: hypothetical protein A2W94_10475 [Bacteroidetes bacterium GWE2_42_42]OFY55762.1 MAG: hypothetical protein A2W93_01600 [Bacteroidetes bacterium GWF2_43_63]
MKRILLLSDINSAHTQKWARILVSKGFAVGIFSLSLPGSNWYNDLGIILLSQGGFSNNTFNAASGSKISYLKKRKEVRAAIEKFKPDYVHAHYASSYGLLGALSGFHPYFISVWGSDVLLFPSNPIKKAIIRYNFRKADQIIVSSRTLDAACRKYTSKKPQIIPFGIDTKLFTSCERAGRNEIRIGTVKSLNKVYGIDLLISVFANVVKLLAEKKITLTIVGEGPELENLTALAGSLNIADRVFFLPPVSQQKLVEIFHSFDIAVFLSRSESFGVAVLEASATGLPVVVSAVGGLTEVVDDGITGFHTECDNLNEVADKLIRLINNSALREQIGQAGREKVKREYELNDTVREICDLYMKGPAA